MDDPAEWLDPYIYAEPWDTVVRLLESSPDVSTFIKTSAHIEAPPRPTQRFAHPSPVPV